MRNRLSTVRQEGKTGMSSTKLIFYMRRCQVKVVFYKFDLAKWSRQKSTFLFCFGIMEYWWITKFWTIEIHLYSNMAMPTQILNKTAFNATLDPSIFDIFLKNMSDMSIKGRPLITENCTCTVWFWSLARYVYYLKNQ